MADDDLEGCTSCIGCVFWLIYIAVFAVGVGVIVHWLLS